MIIYEEGSPKCKHNYAVDCPYCTLDETEKKIKELEAEVDKLEMELLKFEMREEIALEQLAKAEDFVTYCMGLDMPEVIRKKAKDYFGGK